MEKMPEKKDKYRRECKGRRGIDSFLVILHQDYVKKRMNRITATWWNGCFEKMDDPGSHHTKVFFFKSSLLLNG